MRANGSAWPGSVGDPTQLGAGGDAQLGGDPCVARTQQWEEMAHQREMAPALIPC